MYVHIYDPLVLSFRLVLLCLYLSFFSICLSPIRSYRRLFFHHFFSIFLLFIYSHICMDLCMYVCMYVKCLYLSLIYLFFLFFRLMRVRENAKRKDLYGFFFFVFFFSFVYAVGKSPARPRPQACVYTFAGSYTAPPFRPSRSPPRSPPTQPGCTRALTQPPNVCTLLLYFIPDIRTFAKGYSELFYIITFAKKICTG